MRTLSSIFILLFLVFSVGIPVVSAQERLIVSDFPIGQPTTGTGFLGQDHYYSVTFRGNGEATVTLKAIFTNTGNESLRTLTFRIPKIQPQDVTAYQVQREQQCVRWRPYPVDLPLTESEPSTGVGSDPSCAEYSEPDYYGYYYGGSKYVKAETSLNGDTITVNLINPVEVNKSASVMLYYRGMGYAKKNWVGAYPFTFETAKVPDRIRNVQVGISTDSDLILKQATGNVNYRFQMAETGLARVEDTAAQPAENSQLDQVYQGIGYGTLVKNASELQPLESYTVTGEYAKSTWQLYSNTIVISLLVFAVLIGIGLFAGRSLYRRLNKDTSTSNKTFSFNTFLIVGAAGFGSAFLMLCYTLLLIFLASLFATQSLVYSSSLPFFMIGLMIISGAIYIFLFVTPAVVIGIKKGLWAGVLTAVETIVWLGIFLIIGSVLMAVFARQPGDFYPSPIRPIMMQGSDNGIKQDVMPVEVQSAPPSSDTTKE